MTRIWFVSALSWRVSGVTSSFVTLSMPLMWPTSVVMPVLVDEDRARAARDLGVHEGEVDAVAEAGALRDGLDLLGTGTPSLPTRPGTGPSRSAASTACSRPARTGCAVSVRRRRLWRPSTVPFHPSGHLPLLGAR